MSSSVDSRIVTMKFDNNLFEQKVAKTMSTMDRLKEKLQFSGAAKGLNVVGGLLSKIGLRNPFSRMTLGAAEMQRNVSKVPSSFAQIEGGISHISRSWLAMATVAITALSRVTSAAITSGARAVNSFTLGPIMQGFHEYELQMGSIQTILANTQKYGTTLSDVKNSLNELNHYADKTIYSFSDMTHNIGLFTNAGIRLGDATAMIKGFSNEAAASGASAEQAAHAAQQLSQGISTGTIRAMDWFSLTNAGMGNSNMKSGLVDIADAMGTFNGKEINAHQANKDFKGSLEKGWLTADVMTKYLKIMAGEMSNAQMKAMGLSDAQIKMFNKQQKTAEDAATKVRTLTQLFSTMKEAIGSGWAKSFQLIFGDFKGASKLFTNRNKVLSDWSKNGGRSAFLDGLLNGFKALMSILGPIRQGFHDVFPKATGDSLKRMSENFRDFMKSLIASKSTMEDIRHIAGGFFAVFDIGWQIIKKVIGVLFTLFGAMGGGQGHILNFAGSIGEFLISLDKAIKNGGLLTGFFTGLSSVLSLPVRLLGKLADLIGNLFNGWDGATAEKFRGTMHNIGGSLTPLEGAGLAVRNFFMGIVHFLGRFGSVIADNLQKIGDVIANAWTPHSFDKILGIVQTGLLGGIFLLLRNFFKKGLKIDMTGGIAGKVKESLGSVTNTMKAMQQQIKADVIIKIAAALALLTASIVVLAQIDGKKLAKALVGLTIGLAGLSGGLVVLSKFISIFGAAKLPLISAGMILLAASTLIMAFALKIMAKVPWDDLLKGLTTIGIMLAMFAGFAMVAPLTMGLGLGFLALAAGITVLASALQKIAKLSLADIAKGLGTIAAALVIIAAAMYVMPKGLIFTGTGLMMIGLGLMAIAHAVSTFGKMSLFDIAKGLVAMTASLAILSIAVKLFPLRTALIGAGLILLGVGLSGIGHAIGVMGGMDIGTIAKGLITLALALTILAVGLNAIGLTGIAGAAALLITAAALAIFAPALAILGSMSWGSIVKGLVTLAAAFTILGVAGYLLSPVILVILGLAAALFIIGGALLLAGAGVFLLASGIAILVASGTAGMAVLIGALKAVINMIPLLAKKLAEGMIIWMVTLAKGGGKLVSAMAGIMIRMLDAVIKIMPKIRQAMSKFVGAMLGVLSDNIPKIVNTGMKLVLALLRGVDNNISRITSRAISICIKFINAVAKKLPAIIQAGVNFIIKFINGVTRAIDNNSERMGRAGGKLGVAIVRGMIKGVGAMQSELFGSVAHMAAGALHAAMNIFDSHSPSREFEKIGRYGVEGLVLGFDKNAHLAAKASEATAQGAVDSARGAISRISDALSTDMDSDITISPVLDLTQLVKDANSISGLITPPTITATVSYQAAEGIALDRRDAEDARASAAEGSGNTYVDLTQVNNSPKALDPIETYRNTKNLLSTTKEALKVK